MRWDHRLLLCVGVALLCSAAIVSPSQMWTKLILTQHWPRTFCGMQHHCQANLSYWTLHGLWPDKGMDCNNTWPFNSSQIQDLLPDMEKSWPDLLNPTSPSFWKYEWHKHGTCAAKADSLNSQHKYFSKALELYHILDMDRVLRKFNIVPSDQIFYSYAIIESVLEKVYTVKPKIQCVHPQSFLHPHGFKVQTLGQIEICYTPEFILTDCDKHVAMETTAKTGHQTTGFSVCDPKLPVSYPPTS